MIHRTALALWIGDALLVLMAFISEMTPILLGMGENAKVDWGFFWVTMHFIVLPIVSVGLVVLSLLGTVYALCYKEYRRAIFCLAPAGVPALYLAGLRFYPGSLLGGFFS
jgi:hypothetical protein